MDGPPRLLLEGEVHPVNHWKFVFAGNGIDVFQDLVNKGALKRVGNKAGYYRLDFVGIVAFHDRSIVCMPKIYDDGTGIVDARDLSKIVRCIQKYQQRVRLGIVTLDTLDGSPLLDDAGPMLNVFIALMAWTREHGIHQEEAAAISDAQSNIDWSYTFDNATAVHLRTGPVYTDLYGVSDVQLQSKLGLIQSVALLHLHSTFGLVAELWASKFDPMMQQCVQVLQDTSSPPLHYLEIQEAILDGERHATRDHDRELVVLLRQWFDSKGDFNKGPRLFGVNAFHTIWEDICSVVLDAENSGSIHLKIASQARYTIGKRELALARQRPDQVIQNGERIWVVDAKWFRTNLSEFPPLPDVIKQIMYGITVSDKYILVANCFIVPVNLMVNFSI